MQNNEILAHLEDVLKAQSIFIKYLVMCMRNEKRLAIFGRFLMAGAASPGPEETDCGENISGDTPLCPKTARFLLKCDSSLDICN